MDYTKAGKVIDKNPGKGVESSRSSGGILVLVSENPGKGVERPLGDERTPN